MSSKPLLCVHCEKPIANDSALHTPEGAPIHAACTEGFMEAKIGIFCFHCDEPLVDSAGKGAVTWLDSAPGRKFHADCVEAYKQCMRPKCATCGKPILESSYEGDNSGKKWHTACGEPKNLSSLPKKHVDPKVFPNCDYCGKPIHEEEAGVEDEEGKKLHERCVDAHKMNTRPKCAACGKPIVEDSYEGDETGSRYWHNECTKALTKAAVPVKAKGAEQVQEKIQGTCHHCGKALAGSFAEDNSASGKKFHIECVDAYKAKSRPKCAKCAKPIMEGKSVTDGNLSWHQDCYIQQEHDEKKMPEQEKESIKARLIRFYEFYAPDKLKNVDAVLEQYGDRSQDLFSALVKKYGPEPSSLASVEKCSHCQQPLADASGKPVPFAETEEKGKKFHVDCIEAYKAKSRPKCTKCGKPILDEATVHDGKGNFWHQSCAPSAQPTPSPAATQPLKLEPAEPKPTGDKCEECGNPFSKPYSTSVMSLSAAPDKKFHPDCVEKYKAKTRPKCIKCEQPIIEDSYVKTASGFWHKGCRPAKK